VSILSKLARSYTWLHSAPCSDV